MSVGRRLFRFTRAGRMELHVALIGVALGLGFALVAAVAGWSSRLETVLVFGVVAAFGVFAIRVLSDSVDEFGWAVGADRLDYAYVPEDRVAFFERRLEICTADARVFETRIQPVLRTLTDHSLRRRGIDPDRQPDTARDLAGPTLWALIRQPPGVAPTPAQLADAIDHLERLSSR